MHVRTPYRVLPLFACAVLLLLSGCGKFFPPVNGGGGGGGGGGGTSSGDYLYVGNIGTNPLTVAGFNLGNSSLGVASGSPWDVPLEPTALAITPDNSYLYMGSAAGGIYVYSIASNGSLSLGNSGGPVATGVEPSVLRVDPTGKWLLGADSFSGEAYVFQIGPGGSLTAISSSFVTLNSSIPATDLQITPSGSFVYVSCGTAGIYGLSFNAGNGALSQITFLAPRKTGAADQSMAITPSGNFLLAAETVTGGVRVLSIGASGKLTEATGSPYATGPGPWSVIVDSTGSYVYVADRTKANISAFGMLNSGALTPITGSPFSTGILPVALAEDNTHSYIAVICSGGNPDFQVFKISTTTPGALTSFATAKTGVDPTQATVLVATH